MELHKVHHRSPLLQSLIDEIDWDHVDMVSKQNRKLHPVELFKDRFKMNHVEYFQTKGSNHLTPLWMDCAKYIHCDVHMGGTSRYDLVIRFDEYLSWLDPAQAVEEDKFQEYFVPHVWCRPDVLCPKIATNEEVAEYQKHVLSYMNMYIGGNYEINSKVKLNKALIYKPLENEVVAGNVSWHDFVVWKEAHSSPIKISSVTHVEIKTIL